MNLDQQKMALYGVATADANAVVAWPLADLQPQPYMKG